MGDSSESISLLGGSQTFLGVLATIIILCLFSNGSNFIYKILSEIKRQIVSSISSLEDMRAITDVSENSDYKLLLYFIDKKEQQSDDGNIRRLEGIKLMGKIDGTLSKLQYDYVLNQPYINKGIELTKKSEEQFLAPLYTFIFCLIVFVFDELLRYFECQDILVSCLSVFTLLSYLFWGSLWWFFFKRTSLKCLSGAGRNSESGKQRMLFNKLIWIPGLILGCLGIAFIVAYYFHAYPLFCRTVLIVCITVPLLAVGGYTLKIHIKTGNYTRLFLLGHSFIIIILSIGVAKLVYYAPQLLPPLQAMLCPYTNCFWLKIAILFFALVNGVLFPFIMPYFRYMSYLSSAKRKVKKSRKAARKIMDDLQKELKAFSKEVPKPYNE